MVMDPPSALPSPSETADPEEGVASLRLPLAESSARALSRAFFRAIVAEDMPTLATLVMPDATFSAPSSTPRARVLDVYRARTQRFDYLALAEEAIYEEGLVRIYRFDDFDEETTLAVARPAAMKPGDLLLRVPIVQTETSAGKVFGDEISLVIGQDGNEARIRAVVEEFLGW